MTPPTKKRGFARLQPAIKYSIQGLRQAWSEPAFFMEICLAAILLPMAFVFSDTWLEMCFLFALVIFVLVVELLNTSIESAIDRIGLQFHPLSQRSKDLGSAAVFLSLLLCIVVWGIAFVRWILKSSILL
jgi:diacylglycerol kinase (ATP)